MELSKCPILNSEPLTVRATGAGITEIDILPTNLTYAINLYVSYNKIKTIENVVQFKSLECFLAENNEIRYIDDLLPLASLKRLRIVRLSGNPLTNAPFWMLFVSGICPSVESIDGVSVNEIIGKKHNKKWPENFVRREQKLLHQISELTFLESVIVSGKHPLKNKFEEEFSKFFDKEGLFAFYDEIRCNCDCETADEYLSYLDKRCKNYCKHILDKCEENGVPGDVLTRLSELTDNTHVFSDTLKEYVDYVEVGSPKSPETIKSFVVKGTPFDAMSVISSKSKASESFCKRSYRSSPSRSVMKYAKKKQSNNESMCEASNIYSFGESSITKNEKSHDTKQSSTFDEQKTELTIDEEQTNENSPTLDVISEIKVDDEKDQEEVFKESDLKDGDDKETLMNIDELNDTTTMKDPTMTFVNGWPSPRLQSESEEDEKNEDDNAKDLEQEDAEIETSALNNVLSCEMRQDNTLERMFTIWKGKTETRCAVDNTQRLTFFEKEANHCSMIKVREKDDEAEIEDDSLEMITQLKNKRLLLMKIEQQKELNSVLQNRYEQLSREVSTKKSMLY